jgi:hypothetical protein
MSSPSPAPCERMADPILLEALLNQRVDIEGSTSTTQCDVSCLLPIEEIHSPLLLRSETEQLVGQELIKALSDLKQLPIAPLSPQGQQHSSSLKESNVEHLVGTQSFGC